MSQSDFVYKQVLKGCLDAGVSQTMARNQAQTALEQYKRNMLHGNKSVGAFILDQIKRAKKAAK